jgi:uroporphyrin-3 C-methyltransferase
MSDNEREEPVQSELEPDIPHEGDLVEEQAPAAERAPLPLALILALVAVIAVTAGLVLGYQYTRELQQSLQGMNEVISKAGEQQNALQSHLDKIREAVVAQKQRLTEQQQRIEEQQKVFAAQEEKLQQERTRLERQGAEMQQALEGVHQRIGRSSSEWMAAEAEYLIRVANYRLTLEEDLATAVSALRAADERLRDTGDPVWINVREELARELAALRAVEAVDRPGLAARISGLIAQIPKLEIPGSHPASKARQDNSSGGGERSLRTLFQDGWEGFKKVMVIRRHDRAVTAMLPPEQHYFLYQNLQLQLEAARLALLRRDQALFDASLQTAEQWVGQFFDGEKAQTKAIIEDLSALKRTNIAPKMPDISGALRLLRERMQAGGEDKESP